MLSIAGNNLCLAVGKASAPANAPYLLPVGKKKPTIYGQLKQVLRYEDNNSLSPGYSYSADNEYVRYF